MAKAAAEGGTRVRQAGRAVGRAVWRVLFPPLGIKHTAVLCRELHALYTGGIPIGRGLDIIAEHAGGRRMRRAVRLLAGDLRRGATLADSVQWRSDRFPEFFVECVAAGERSGKLADAFLHLAEYYEECMRLRRELLNQLAYPLAVLGAIGIVMGPVLKEFGAMSQGGRFDTGGVLEQMGWRIVHVAVTLAVYWYAYLFLRQIPYVRLAWGFVAAHLWPLRPIARGLALARFFRGLAMQLEAGIGAPRSIESAARMCGNAAVALNLAQASGRVRTGTPIAAALAVSPYLPPMADEMLRVGERSGKLDETLRKVSQYCLQEATHRMWTWVGLVEALLILSLALGGLPLLLRHLFGAS